MRAPGYKYFAALRLFFRQTPSQAKPGTLLQIKELDPSQMSPAFERSLEPGAHDLQSSLLCQHPLAQRNHIGIIVLPRQARCLNIPAESATHSFEAIGDHSFTIARAAEHDTALGLAASHRKSYRTDKDRVIDWLFRIGAEIID